MTAQEKITKILGSPQLYIENFMKVVDKSGKLVKFKLNPQQKKLITNLDKYNIVLKSRQLGITTLSCAYSLYLANTQPNTTCLLMSYSIDSATGIFEKLKQLYNDIPSELRVEDIANNKKELKLINGSRIIVSTCGNKDVARGLTIRFAHLSEVGFMKDTVDSQLLAIEQSLVPKGVIILESTANGMNHFAEMWNKAERRDSLYKPFFFPWVEDKLMFAEEYSQFAERYVNMRGQLPTEDELSQTEKFLLDKGATIEQLVWRRLKIANSDENQFRQEFPATPEEAFVTTGTNVFESVHVYARLKEIDSVPKLKLPPSFPLELKPYVNEISLWQLPATGKRYYAGVDTGEGIGSDYSVIEIVDNDGFQCAEFRSNRIKPFTFADVVNKLSMYYNKALLVVEKASAGHTVLDKLKHQYQYYNLFRMREYDARGKRVARDGFNTTAKTKPLMIGYLTELFETNQLCLNCRELLKEMLMYVHKDGSTEASHGEHDDCVMTLAMALQGMKSGVQYI